MYMFVSREAAMSSLRCPPRLSSSTTLVLALALLLFVLGTPASLPVYAANTVGDFGRQYQAMMESSGKGFSMFYRDMIAPPVPYSWGCTVDLSSLYSVAYASATAPYTVTVSSGSMTVARTAAISSVSYNLMGLLCTTNALCGDIQTGSSLTFSFQSNSLVMVAGQITSNSVVNYLPVAYYVMLPASACSSTNGANVTSIFGASGSVIWEQLWL